MHSTFDVKDDYLGSGSYLWNSIKKYGIENHTRDILEFLPTREALKNREREIVNEKCLVDPRRYRMEKNQIVFEAVVGCEERRVTIEALDQSNFKAIDPEDGETIRTFRRISEEVYHKLVKPSERKL
jgi:hypothetical protein